MNMALDIQSFVCSLIRSFIYLFMFVIFILKIFKHIPYLHIVNEPCKYFRTKLTLTSNTFCYNII